MTIALSFLAFALLVACAAFMLYLPVYLFRCVIALFGATIAWFEGRGFWHTVLVLWPRVRM
jgi:hypothetical protein